MKRSEMVQGIKDYLDLTEEDPEFLPDSLERANYILDFCEMLGMLPPKRTQTGILQDGFIFDTIVYSNTWEPEDA